MAKLVGIGRLSTMLLTLTTTHEPATDLGFLLRRIPRVVQSFSLSFGKAQVLYPEATAGAMHGRIAGGS